MPAQGEELELRPLYKGGTIKRLCHHQRMTRKKYLPLAQDDDKEERLTSRRF